MTRSNPPVATTSTRTRRSLALGVSVLLGATVIVAAVPLAQATVVPAPSTAPATPAPTVHVEGDVITVDGVSVTAPAPGNATILFADRIDGTSTTIVVDTAADGTVTVGDGSSEEIVAPDETETVAAPAKCNDTAYSLINRAKWRGTYNWRFRASSTPNELTKKGATSALKAAVANITHADNTCGLKDTVGARSSYKGSTSAHTDVTPQGNCSARANGKNVTEFSRMDGTFVAVTCTYTTGPGGRITAASVRINTDYEFWTGGGCSGDTIGLQGIQTHEYGHAFGLGHVDESKHGNLTMSTNLNGWCNNFEANLGKGDVLALRKLY